MEKPLKKYIFLTVDIHPIGGIQNYIAGKAKYLKKQGWDVVIFFGGYPTGTCLMPTLNEYIDGGILELIKQPGEWTKHIRELTLSKMKELIQYDKDNKVKIVIESHDDVLALWGELLAEKIHAKHMCFICNEKFRGPKKHYAEHFCFFDFKHSRKELLGIHKESLEQLFEGYKEVKPEERYSFVAANEGPVQDVENKAVESLTRSDWNICYIGRVEKLYVPKIIQDISIFAQKYTEKTIQFLVVGKADSCKKLLQEKLGCLQNVKISLLGDLIPIPRSLFQLTDVVIAGSGCADCAARENVPTIVADADNGMANGLLGYTTHNILYCENKDNQINYDVALEQVLVEKIQEYLEFYLEDKLPASEYYKKQIEFIKQSEKELVYYKLLKDKVSMNHIKVFKYYMNRYAPFVVNIYRKAKR